jgi:hypothetical protein
MDLKLQENVMPPILPEWPESVRPAFIRALARPTPLIKVDALAFVIFEKPDLDEALRFLTDFGLQLVRRDSNALYMRGTGTAPFCYIVRHAMKPRFVGIGFEAASLVDLDVLVREAGAKSQGSLSMPGGGRGVRLTDPAGREVWVVHGRAAVAPLPGTDLLRVPYNGPKGPARINATVRPPLAPAAVVGLGHLAIQTTDFEGTVDWYMRNFGLLASDVLYLPDGTPNLAFLRLDRGDRPADHHSVVFAGGLTEQLEHSAYEVQDLDALGQGSQYLARRGWKHAWGIGRHLLGSQIFDYWFDADGCEHEHYTDGDAFTAEHEPCYSPLNAAGLYAWGPDLPAHMLPRLGPANLWRALKLVARGKLSFKRLKSVGAALGESARPWMQ